MYRVFEMVRCAKVFVVVLTAVPEYTVVVGVGFGTVVLASVVAAEVMVTC